MNPRLGVNIDHIATLRQVRGVTYPDPVASLDILKRCGVDQVTLHLREDRRHIQDHDLTRVMAAKKLPVNLEMAVTSEMVKLAAKTKPHTATFVPEKREELTTEGGLDCVAGFKAVAGAVKELKAVGIRVSLFIDADENQIRAAREAQADAIEIHTGTFCNIIEAHYEKTDSYDYAKNTTVAAAVKQEALRTQKGATLAKSLGLKVFAGHGLHCDNLKEIVAIKEIEEYNIGHAIIARAIFVGLELAIKEIQQCLSTK